MRFGATPLKSTKTSTAARQALKIEWNDATEFRVGGMTPDQVDDEMIAYVESKIAECESYEKSVAAWQRGEPMPDLKPKPKEAVEQSPLEEP